MSQPSYTIRIPRWEEFQHYHGGRTVLWIKLYTRLLSDDAFLSLTWAQRGVLVSLWLEYARTNAHRPPESAQSISGDTSVISRRVGGKVRKDTLEALNQAGFIELSASSLLADGYQLASAEKKREEKTLAKGPSGADFLERLDVDLSEKPRKKKTSGDPRFRKGDGTARYTGCRQTRGAGGFGYVRDPLGIDLPPADWPYPKPTAEEIVAARRARLHVA